MRLKEKTAALAVELSSNLGPNLLKRVTKTFSRVVDTNWLNPSIDVTIPTTVVTIPENILPMLPSPFSGSLPTAIAPRLNFVLLLFLLVYSRLIVMGIMGRNVPVWVRGNQKMQRKRGLEPVLHARKVILAMQKLEVSVSARTYENNELCILFYNAHFIGR